MLYQDDTGKWKPVDGSPDYAIRKADPVTVKFKPVTSKALRIEIKQAVRFSSGLYEWELITGE